MKKERTSPTLSHLSCVRSRPQRLYKGKSACIESAADRGFQFIPNTGVGNMESKWAQAASGSVVRPKSSRNTVHMCKSQIGRLRDQWAANQETVEIISNGAQLYRKLFKVSFYAYRWPIHACQLMSITAMSKTVALPSNTLYETRTA